MPGLVADGCTLQAWFKQRFDGILLGVSLELRSKSRTRLTPFFPRLSEEVSGSHHDWVGGGLISQRRVVYIVKRLTCKHRSTSFVF